MSKPGIAAPPSPQTTAVCQGGKAVAWHPCVTAQLSPRSRQSPGGNGMLLHHALPQQLLKIAVPP